MTFKNLIAEGMSYNDIMEADYYHLMELLSVDEKVKKDEVVDLSDFVKSLS